MASRKMKEMYFKEEMEKLERGVQSKEDEINAAMEVLRWRRC